MIVCNNSNNYNIVKSLRSHGWSRETNFHNYYKKKFKKIDERFLFINSGYNLRPTEVQAAIAQNQFKRLKLQCTHKGAIDSSSEHPVVPFKRRESHPYVVIHLHTPH